MVTTPSDGVTSRAYRVLIDDTTGKQVSRETLSKDTYRSVMEYVPGRRIA